MGDVDSKEKDNKNGVNDEKDLENITNTDVSKDDVSNDKMETIRNNSLIVDSNEKDQDESNLVIDLDQSTSKSPQTAKDKKMENVLIDRNLWDSTVDELMKGQPASTVDSSVDSEKGEDEKIHNDSVNDSVCGTQNETRHGANEEEHVNEPKESVDNTKKEEGKKDNSQRIDHVVYLDGIKMKNQDKATIVNHQIESEPANAGKDTNFTTEMDETDGDVEQVKQHALSVGETDTISVEDVRNGFNYEQTNRKQSLENVETNKSIHVLSKSDEINRSEMKGDGGSKESKQLQRRNILSKDTNGKIFGNSEDSVNTTRKEKTDLINPCAVQKVIESKSDYLCKQCEKCQCVCSEVPNNGEASHQKQGQKISSVANAAAKQQQASAAWSRLGVLRCEHCKFTTDDVSLIDSHNVICSKKSVKTKVMLSYSGERFNCQTCGYPTSSRKKFEEHIALHLMIRPYICMTCDITFESKKEIEFHVKMKHANDAVKCGLKGSKRIGQIIDSLINSQKHEFLGRTVDKKIVQSLLETSKPKEKINASAVVATPSLQTSVPVTTRGSISSNFVPVSSDADVIFVSSATTGITTTCVSSNLLSKQPETTLIGQPVPLTTQRPLILVPVNNMNTNMLVPFSNVVSQTNICNVNTASSQSGVSVSTLTGSNQFINLAPVRFASQNFSISGNTVHTNSIHGLQGNAIPATTLQGSNSIQGSTIQVNNMQTIQGNAFPPNTFQGVHGNASSYPGFSQNVNFQNSTTRFVLLPQTTVNPVARSQAPLTNQQNKSISNITGVLLNHAPMMSLITPTVVQTPNVNTYAVTQGQTNTATSVTKESSLSAQNINCVAPTTNTSTEVLAKKDKSTSEDMKSSMVETNGNKLYFRKYGDLYMCDYCKSETPLEDSFKEHIWKHFHQMQKICKDCPPTFNVSAPCKIVLKVMIGLLSSSTGSQISSPNKTQVSLPKDIVTISDDEDDGDGKLRVDEAMKEQNVIVCPSTEERSDTVKIASASEPKDEGLQLKITSTFSLSDTCESTEKTEPILLKHQECIEDPDKNDTSNRKLISAKNDKATSSTVTEDSRKMEKAIETISLDSDESNSSDSHKSKALRVENDFNVEECEKDFHKTHDKEENLSKENERLVEESHSQSGKSGIEDVILRETRKVSSNDEELEREGQSLQVQDIAVVAANIKEEIVDTDQDPTQLLFRIVKTEDAFASTNDIDKKPIAFPLVAFYKCGFENCKFETTTSLEFREHLSQSHGDAVEYKCAHCGQKSFTEDSHIRHLLFHSKPQNSLLFQCGVIGCRFRANLLHHYKDHLELSHQNVLLHRCHSCKEGYTSVDLLIEHLQSNLLKFVQCPYCTMKDGMRRNVLNHITAFHPGKPRQINVTSQLVCQERETNEFEKAKSKLPQETSNSILHVLANEQKKSTRTEPHKQGDTRGIDEKSSKLTDKVENDPEDAEMISKITSNPSIMGATYYRCKSCTYIGIGQNKLLKHMEMHTSAFIQSVQRPFICPDCPQAVNTLQQFISHLNLHVGDHLCYIYICQHCGFGTNLSNKINQHTTDSHGTSSEEGKDYTQRTIKFSVTTKVCVKCNAAFKTSQAHRDHVLKSHGITTNEISGKDDLETEQHGHNITSVHNKISKDNDDESNPRRFTCNECGWASKKLPYLKSHMRKHYPGQDRCQITLFKCNYCDFTSTSKLIISAHSQKKHPGKIVRPKRVMENVYITDSIEDDMSIDKFHCDLCTFSTEKVSGLQNHLLSSHSGANNKTKDVYSGPKQEFLIPSGTVFKEFIKCPLCIFKTKKRIELLRHIKSHPSLEPKTESATEGQVNERVQNPLFSKLGGKRRISSDLNPVVKKPRPVSPTISYDRIMMDSAKRDTGYRKQVATKSTTNRPSIGVKSMLYYLGGEQLHMKLRPCFSEFKQSTHFTCLICSDVLDDKYKLHKHVLQHMNVYFYKCAYCDHGTLDQTTIMVHIQREHRRAIQYSKLDVEEIDSHINKAIHDMKSQVGSGQENIVFEEMHKESSSEKLKKTDEKDINQILEVKNEKDEKITTETPKLERESSIKSEIVSKKLDAPLLKHDIESPLQKERPFQAKIYPTKSTSSNLEKLFPIKSASSNVDKKSPIKSTSSNLEKLFPIKSTSSNVDKKSPIKSASSNVDKKSPIKSASSNVEKISPVMSAPTNVEKKSPLKSTSSNLDKKSPQKQQILAHKPLKRECTFQHWGGKMDTTKEEEEPERQENDDTIKEEVEDLHPRIKKEKNNYVCTICELKVSQKSAANKHIWTHSSVKRFVCSICNHISRWRGDITKHMDQKHKSEKAECLWDDVTPCDITEDGLPYNDLAKVQFLSTFNTIKSETLGSEQKLESDISDIKISSPNKRPLKVKLSVSKVEDKKKQVEEQPPFKKLYKCLICKKTFKSKYAILGHFRTECKKPMFGCPSCKFKDADEKAVKKHMKIKHGINNGEVTIKTRNDKIRMYRVPCGESGIKNEDSKKQLSGGIAFKCKACKRTFKNRNACMYHAISALCNKTLKGCSHCDYMDISTDNVELHIKKDHKEKNVKVTELPMEAKVEMISTPPSTKMNLNKSGTIAFFKKGSSGYTCRLCDFKCKNSAAVIKHQNMHNASPKYGCPYCDMKSNWTKSVKNHVSLRHPEQEQIVQSLIHDTEDYSSKDKKTDSISKVSNTSTTEDDKGKKCVMSKCLQCNFRCETYSGVSRHIKKNESCNVPRFKCIDCHKFTSLDEMEVKEHMRTAHNSKKSPGLCSLKEMTKMIIVRKKSTTKTPAPSEKDSTTDKSRIAEKFSGMKDIETKVIKCPVLSCNCKDKIIKVIEHYRREHPTKVMRCKMCTMSSKSLGTMFQHFQDFHKLEEYYSTNFLTCSGSRDDNKLKSIKNDTLTNEDIIEQEAKTNAPKLYHCDRCEYVSKAKNSTRRHIYRHMNYKRYLCRLCKAEFLDRSACESHMAIHNTESEEFDKITNERLEKEVEDILENNMVLGSKKSNSNSIEKVKLKKKEESLETIQETKSKSRQSMKSDSKNKNEIIKDCKGAVSNKIEKKRTSDLKQVDFTKLSADAFNQAYFIREERNKTTKEMEYLCTKCPYKSVAKHCALLHTYRHMPKCMKCPYCNFQSYPRSDIKRHVRNTHADKAVHVIDLRHQTLDGKEKPRSPDKKRKKTFLDFDAEIFTSEGSSDEEEEKRRKKPLQKTSGGSESPKTDDKIRKIIYSCNLCDYSTDVLYLYRQHLTFHPGFKHQIQGTSLESKNKCGYCGYIATNSKEFDKHMERHLNSRPYNCPYCQFSQYNQASVRYHIQNKHPGEKVEVVKDRSSSCLTGDGKIPKVLLVNIEPNIVLRDIFTMESESFEELLINANVSVIDLHSIPDEQFGNVSKLLGVNGDEDEWKPSPQKKRKMIEETEESDDERDEGGNDSDNEVDARNYCDASDDGTNITDDETHIADDESHHGEGDHGKKDKSTDKIVNEKKKTSVINTPSTTNVSSTEYEDISDTEMDSENGAIFKMNEQKFYVKSELTYEDISDTDDF